MKADKLVRTSQSICLIKMVVGQTKATEIILLRCYLLIRIYVVVGIMGHHCQFFVWFGFVL